MFKLEKVVDENLKEMDRLESEFDEVLNKMNNVVKEAFSLIEQIKEIHRKERENEK